MARSVFGPDSSHVARDAYGRGDPYTATAAVEAGASDVAEVTITVKDIGGDAVSGPVNMDVWLSDDAAGTGVTATAASGTVTDKTAGTTGIVLGTYTAKKALRVQTLADGTYVLAITDSAATEFVVCCNPGGRTVVVATLAAASYGA